MSDSTRIWIEPWTDQDRELLGALLGDPRMTEHLGGPESDEQLDRRQARYESDPRQHRIRIENVDEGVGYVGFWDREWRDLSVWETGWGVRPEFQGRGLASAGMRLLIDVMRRDGNHRYVHAFPGVDNGPSNALCRKLGFEFLDAFDFEYPVGHPMRCNDWRLDLEATARADRAGIRSPVLIGAIRNDGQRVESRVPARWPDGRVPHRRKP